MPFGMNSPILSIVIPVYNEQEVLPLLKKKFLEFFQNQNFELILVDDRSQDLSAQFLKEWSKEDSRVHVICNDENIGHQASLYIGMLQAKHDMIVTMDADLQDPVELIAKLVEKSLQGFDVVHAKRTKAGSTVIRNVLAWGYYRTLKVFKSSTLIDVGDFRLVTRRALELHQKTFSTGRYLRGEFSQLPLLQGLIPYVRGKRMAGKTKYTWCKLLKLAWNGFLRSKKS